MIYFNKIKKIAVYLSKTADLHYNCGVVSCYIRKARVRIHETNHGHKQSYAVQVLFCCLRIPGVILQLFQHILRQNNWK